MKYECVQHIITLLVCGVGVFCVDAWAIKTWPLLTRETSSASIDTTNQITPLSISETQPYNGVVMDGDSNNLHCST